MAKLKALIDKLEDVEEAFRGLYTKTEAGFVLDVDGDTYKKKVEKFEEFRSNNTKLMNEKTKLEEQLKAFEGVDPDQANLAREALDRIKNEEEKNLIKLGNYDEVVKRRTETMRKDYENRFTALDTTNKGFATQIDILSGELAIYKIDSAALSTLSEMGVAPRKTALPDIVNRARREWKLDKQGSPIPIKSDGSVNYASDGATPITMQDWAKSLVQSADHLFEPADGGGAGGGTKKAAGDGSKTIGMENFGKNIDKIASGEINVRMPAET